MSHEAVWGPVARFDGFLAQHLRGLGPILGGYLQMKIDEPIHGLAGILTLPSTLAHFGEGFGCFWGHPSWATAPGLMRDVGTTAMVVGFSYGLVAGGAAAGDGAAAESAGAGPETGSLGCFVAGTPIRLADGTTKPIEQIRVGDRVLARDKDSGIIEAKRVAHTFVRSVDHTVLLTLPSGEQIETTEEHPFYVAGHGYVGAGHLGIGTQIVTRAGPAVGLARLERRGGPQRVYNFEVAGLHSYLVGRSGGGLCVHNAIECGSEPSSAVGGTSEAPEVIVGDVSGGTVTESEALDLAEEWLGPEYEEASPGRFTSRTYPGRQFRMKSGDLGDKVPHVHFESIGKNGRDILVNLHLNLK